MKAKIPIHQIITIQEKRKIDTDWIGEHHLRLLLKPYIHFYPGPVT